MYCCRRNPWSINSSKHSFIVYGLATGTSIGRLFLCGVIPGLLLAGLFMLWAYIYSYFIDKKSAEILRNRKPPTLREKLEVIPRVLPFLLIVVGVLYVLYGGVATPSEASGVGAFLVFVMIAVVYKIYQPKKIWDIVKVSMKESVMIMFIIAGSYIFAFSLIHSLCNTINRPNYCRDGFKQMGFIFLY